MAAHCCLRLLLPALNLQLHAAWRLAGSRSAGLLNYLNETLLMRSTDRRSGDSAE